MVQLNIYGQHLSVAPAAKYTVRQSRLYSHEIVYLREVIGPSRCIGPYSQNVVSEQGVAKEDYEVSVHLTLRKPNPYALIGLRGRKNFLNRSNRSSCINPGDRIDGILVAFCDEVTACRRRQYS